MSDREWEKLFDLIKKVVELPRPSWQDRRDEVLLRASRESDDGAAFDEFISWFHTEEVR